MGRVTWSVGWQRFEPPPLDLTVADARAHQPVRLAEPVAHGTALRPLWTAGWSGHWWVDDPEVDEWVAAHGGERTRAEAAPVEELTFALGNTVTGGSEWLRGAFDWAHVHAVHGAQRLDPDELRPEATAFRDDWCGAVYGTSIFLVAHLTQLVQLHRVDEHHVVALTIENVFRDRLNTVVTVRAHGPSAPRRVRTARSWRRYVERRYAEDHRIWEHKATDRPPRYGPHDDEIIAFDRYARRLERG